MRNILFFFVLSFLLLFTFPLSAYGGTNTSDEAAEYWLHLVEEDDDLHSLAARYYNNARLWKKIYNANKETIKNPNILYPGQELFIPIIREKEKR